MWEGRFVGVGGEATKTGRLWNQLSWQSMFTEVNRSLAVCKTCGPPRQVCSTRNPRSWSHWRSVTLLASSTPHLWSRASRSSAVWWTSIWRESPSTSETLCATSTPRERHVDNHSDRIQTQKGSNERLFILTRTYSMQIFGEIPFIKPQNDT